jgi:hypothetical protein
MSIHFYTDDAGYVGQPDLPDHALSVMDSAQTAARELDHALRLLEDLVPRIERKGEAVLDEPDGYCHSHARNWRAIEVQVSKLGDLLANIERAVRDA